MIEIESRTILPSYIPPFGVGAEIGVLRGDYSVYLYLGAQPKSFYLVDLWESKFPHLNYFAWNDYIDEVHQKLGMSPNVQFRKKRSTEWLSSLPDDYLDWVYLDSDHVYENTKNELELCVKKVKAGGIVAGHDFTVCPQAWRTGVPRALIEVIQDGKLRMEILTNEQFPSYLCKVTK